MTNSVAQATPTSTPMFTVHNVQGLPWQELSAQDWERALDTALADYETGIAVLSHDPKPATFDNTLGAWETMFVALQNTFGCLNVAQAHATPLIQELVATYSPRRAVVSAKVMQNKDLFRRVEEAFRREGATWSPAQIKLYEDTCRAFRQAGCLASDADKAAIASLQEELAELDAAFDRTNLANNQVTLPIPTAKLLGANADVLSECATSTIDGIEHTLVPVSTPFVEPLLGQVHDRDVRQQLHQAWIRRGRGQTPGDTSTAPIINTILAKRQQLATLLGHPHWAAYVLEDTMAKTTAPVMEMLHNTWSLVVPSVVQDIATLQEFSVTLGGPSRLEAWDIPYYTERYRQAHHDIDTDAIKEYFPLTQVRQAAFEAASRLFGVSFEQDPSIPTYHEDVMPYVVRKDGQPLGVLFIDDHVRSTKAAGAWMDQFATAHQGQRPGVINVLNIPKPSATTPALLSFDEVITIFHELGHAMHGLLGQTTYPSQSGTSVARDFVELPSQMLENWGREKEALRGFARHWKTQEPMPDDMLDRLLAAQKVGQSFFQVAYLQSAIMDMALHATTPPSDVAVFEQTIHATLRADQPLLDALPARHHAHHFSHIFGGGYAAGYYSYLWAEVLEADAFSRFKQEGLWSPSASKDLTALYAAGGSQDEMTTFRQFMGRDPNPQAVLSKWGLEVAAPAPIKVPKMS